MITSLSDWFKVLAPFFQPIRSETKTNRGSRVHIFPRFVAFQNKEMAAMMAYQTNPLGIELYFYLNSFFCLSNPIWLLVT